MATDALIFSVVGMGAFLLPGAWAMRRAKIELVNGSVSRATFGAAFAAYSCIALAVVAAAVFRVAAVNPGPLWQALGFVLSAAGGLVYLAARLQMRSFRMTWGLETSQLLSTGIYAHSRHPQVIGWGTLLLGIAVYSGSLVAMLFVIAFVVATALWIPAEEAAMSGRFGEDYRRYRGRTPIIPRIGPGSKS